MPLVGLRLIGHTPAMIRQCALGNGITATLRSAGTSMLREYVLGPAPLSRSRRKACWLQWPLFLCTIMITSPAWSERDQATIKRDATLQIQTAAAETYYTEASNVEVRLGDKRLVLPDCEDEFQVLFPFNDRATAQLDCASPHWRGFIQIRLLQGATAFRYALPLDRGESLKRSHVIRQAISPDDALTNRVTVLGDVLDQRLRQPVQAGEILLEDHFISAANQTRATVDTDEVGAWIAREIIPRGNRLREESFKWEAIEGRAPSDLVHSQAEFAMLEALRDILPGDKLRRSAVKMAPAVRKNEEVRVIITRGALTVTNIVRISRDATIGEAIQVENVESGRQLRARVTGIGQVEIM